MIDGSGEQHATKPLPLCVLFKYMSKLGETQFLSMPLYCLAFDMIHTIYILSLSSYFNRTSAKKTSNLSPKRYPLYSLINHHTMRHLLACGRTSSIVGDKVWINKENLNWKCGRMEFKSIRIEAVNKKKGEIEGNMN